VVFGWLGVGQKTVIEKWRFLLGESLKSLTKVDFSAIIKVSSLLTNGFRNNETSVVFSGLRWSERLSHFLRPVV